MTDASSAKPLVQSVDGLDVHYIKSSQFRVVYAEGAYGGPSPRGIIEFALYNERRPIPRAGKFHVGGEPPIASEEITDIRTGIVREVEFAVMMTPEMAKGLGKWLLDTAKQLEDAKAIIDAK